IRRDRQRIARAYLDDVSTLYLFLFLNTGRQIESTVSSVCLLQRLDQHAVAHDNQISQLIVSRNFHNTNVSTVKTTIMPRKGRCQPFSAPFLEFAITPHQRYNNPRHEHESSDPQYVDKRFLKRFQHNPIFLSGSYAQREITGFRVDRHKGYTDAKFRNFVRDPSHHFILDDKMRFGQIGHAFSLDRYPGFHSYVLISQFNAGHFVHTFNTLQRGNIVVYKEGFIESDPYLLRFTPVVTRFTRHFDGDVGIQIAGERPADIRRGYNAHLLVCLYAWILYEFHFSVAPELDLIVCVLGMDFELFIGREQFFSIVVDVAACDDASRCWRQQNVIPVDVPALPSRFYPGPHVLDLIACHRPWFVQKQQQVVAVELVAELLRYQHARVVQ